ncbi:uracil phosphoribosyltransferase [Falsiporphyromonas endometrii]|uniref:Uracil phosphoribosyltransferase n=1 Tax=Falsiporphyromonas endometrii TaxID=1387297 RepID=A0ABV9K888_9PORP|nr:uracil phosphoribosyltransferase [Porphyromonadaceae bacterium]
MKTYYLDQKPSLINKYLLEMRDVNIQNDRLRFRENIVRTGELVAYEISKVLKYKEIETQTPLGIALCRKPADTIVLSTILRAGLPFHQGFLNMFDDAENAFVSAYREYDDDSHTDFHVYTEYIASPCLDDKVLIIADPMLATGKSMEVGYRALLKKGTPKEVHIASVIASTEAIEYLDQCMPDNVTLWVASVDQKLNEHSYIVPGLGDAGDLAFGEKL